MRPSSWAKDVVIRLEENQDIVCWELEEENEKEQ